MFSVSVSRHLSAISRRLYSKNVGYNRSKLVRRQERNINKLFGITPEDSDDRRKKWKRFGAPAPISSGPVTAGSQRRARQLSVYLLEYICNAFYQGEVNPQLNEYNLEIDKAKLSPDLKHLIVFWNATGRLEHDACVEDLLEQSKGELRSILSQKQLIGRIPPISFVKNTTNAQLQIVEELLKKADLGPDHIATDLGHKLKTPIDLTKHRAADEEEDEDEGYYYTEGPGGTKEILWCEVQEHEGQGKSGDSVDKNIINTRPPMPSPNTETDEQSMASVHHEVDSKLRCDIYELRHDDLVEKVLNVKKRAKDRGYRIPSSQGSDKDFIGRISSAKNVTSGTLQQYLSRRKEKELRKHKRRNMTIRDLGDEADYELSDSELDESFDMEPVDYSGYKHE